jgi:putative peptide zinc metalloprotease protein
MATLSDSLVSSSARKLSIRRRPDLTARRQHYLGRSYWVVKEPIGQHYFRFQEEEYAILQMLDGRTSLDEIKRRFEAEFPPQKITLEELQQFLGMLHRSGLVIADVPGQGIELRRRATKRRRQELLGAVSNILCIRFKGFDPERVLNWLYPKVRWMFSPVFLALCAAMVLGAGTLVLVEFDVFRSKLPAFRDFFNFYNAMWLVVTLGVTKVLHEFGHGLSCKHFGGECHEMGVMILVLTPCLYCNVSDSWMLPSKWQRAAIGAAGIIVELCLAAACTFIWWFTEPGLLHYMCLNVMFVSSVSTIVFNANPLLRYDGYYILADLVEIPNLRQKATTILSRKAAHWFLGIEPQEDPFLPQRKQIFFALYSIAAAAYRWVVLASIWWFLYQFFKPYGLQRIGQLIIAMSLVTLVGVPLYKIGKFFYIPGRIEKVKKPRMYASLAGVAALLLGVLFVPLPHRVLCTLEIQPRDAKAVYVDLPEGGRIERVHVRPGQAVEPGALLAELNNVDLDIRIAGLEGQYAQYEAKLRSLQQQRFRNPRAGAEVPQVREALDTIAQQLEQKRRDRARLTLRAPMAGTVLPPPSTPRRESPGGQLPGWSRTPLDPENLGAHLDDGVLFCQIGDPAKFEAVLVIDQTDVEFIRAGQTVEIKLDGLPHETLRDWSGGGLDAAEGRRPLTIREVAQSDLKIAPQRLSTKAQGELPTETDPTTGIERPRSTVYQASVPLDAPEGVLRTGLRGQAKIHAGWMPLGKRLWRLVSHTFNFRL